MKPLRFPFRPTGFERRGFALVVTVSMMVLLALLAIGLLSLSTISTRSGQQQVAQAEARANARLALVIALGELQKTLGPDARISARAATLARHPAIGAEVPEGTERAWWVGVAGSDPEAGLDPTRPVGPGNPPVKWLVSGLNPGASPVAQISSAQPFANPVTMFGEGSVDLGLLTGGRPIQAGTVTVSDRRDLETGGFAYLIDDNGMKAQLAPSDPRVRNDMEIPPGFGLLPAGFDLGILDGMADFEGVGTEEYAKLDSLNSLPLIAGDANVVRRKRLGYTTVSRGVLSDVRRGGLKRDLTIAFERDDAFANALSNNARGSGFATRYLVIDPTRQRQANELLQNGYIHWDMFRQYYNIKKHIKTVGRGTEYLDPVQFNKNGILLGAGTPFGRGQLGPHAIGPNASTAGQFQNFPYGDYAVMDETRGKNAGFYKHSPVFPVLQRFQQNAWVEHERPDNPRGAHQLKTRVQMWTSHYNPYNINILSIGNNPSTGPRILTFPQARFSLSGVEYLENGQPRPFRNVSGLHNKRQSHINHEVMIGPGRSHVFAFRNDAAMGSEIDSFLYDDKVRDLTLESVFRDFELTRAPSGRSTLEVDFFMPDPAMGHGTDMNPPAPTGDHEVAQAFWAPVAWNAVDSNRPGVSIRLTASGGELNENTMASHAFRLRTTREGSGALRPLIDGNIRASLNNPKWDSPLGLPNLAIHSAANNGVTDEPFFPMDTRDSPLGYSYWGAGTDPLDGYDRVILFDIPRSDLVSLGQLQHANVGRFSYEPTYIVGNSYANPRIPLDDWRDSVGDSFSTPERGLRDFAIPGRFNLYDASYLVNEELWDSYIFTTIPQIADNRTGPREPAPNASHFRALIEGDALLPNPRFLPYEPPGSRFDAATLQDPGSGRGTSGGFHHNAGHLMVDGAFNVNSISVDAWEAFLSGTHELPYQQVNTSGRVTGFSRPGEVDGVRFPRVRSVMGGPMEKDRPDENYWIGFRSLDPQEVRELAEVIVEEIKRRGPFLTFGDFVNRRLERGETGESGALQAALDRTVNDGIRSSFELGTSHPKVPSYSTQGAGFPGQLLQGDILQALSPYMTVRSDTFTIRAYGESREPGSGRVRARAWCEATVQRFPDPVPDGAGGNALAELVNPSSEFGRMFRLTSFRWLNPGEV